MPKSAKEIKKICQKTDFVSIFSRDSNKASKQVEQKNWPTNLSVLVIDD